MPIANNPTGETHAASLDKVYSIGVWSILKFNNKNNRPIIIFPEGTRSAVGEKGEYKSGISALYKFLGIPCIPVALDSGLYWQTKGLRRNPGKISVKFMPAIPSGLSRKDFERKLEETIEEETNLLINK